MVRQLYVLSSLSNLWGFNYPHPFSGIRTFDSRNRIVLLQEDKMKDWWKILILLVLMYFITTCGKAEASDAIVAEGICVYKLTQYECYLLFAHDKHHIILEKGEKVIAIYEIIDTSFGKMALLVYEYGEDL